MKRQLCLLLLGCFLFPAAYAQDSGESTDPVLEEVIVTAQRRAESIQDVAITIQAYSAEALREAGLKTTDYLSEVVPNLLSTRQIGASTPYLRGVGTQNSAMGDESSIATYVDGVYMASMTGNDLYFNNLERVEVLKGPQGTLYGRNATGGLIHIITKDPSHEATGTAGVSYGDYEMLNVNLYATGGISDTVAADIAVSYQNQGEGYGINLITGEDVNFYDNTSVRSKWLITPSEKARITLIADFADRDGDMGFARGPAPGALAIDGALIFGGCLASGAPPEVCAGAAIAGATKTPDNPQDIQSDVGNVGKVKQWGVSGRIDYSFDNFDFVSITAYRSLDNDDRLDQDATPFSVVDAPLPREEDQLSQEFQLLSSSDGPLSWIVGLFYLKFDAAYTPFQLRGAGLPLLAPGLLAVDLPVSQDTTSYAAYAQLGYDITDQLSIAGGLRYTKDERKVSGNTILDFGPVVFDIPFSGKESWSEPTWHLALDFRATDNLMLFGSYSRGFKSGVFNSVVTTGVLQPPVDPEILDAYEIGFKSDLVGGRVRFNGAAFYYDYQNLQLTAISAGIIRLSNAASAEVTGAELELQVAATKNLEFRAGFGLLNSEYKDFDCVLSAPTGIGGNSQTPGSCDGSDLIRTPKYSGNIGAAYTLPTDSGNFRASFNWYFNDGFFWEPDNRYKEPSYDVLNVEVSWTNAKENMRLRIFGANLTDSEYSLYTNTGQFGDLRSMAPPQTWGVGVDFYW